VQSFCIVEIADEAVCRLSKIRSRGMAGYQTGNGLRVGSSDGGDEDLNVDDWMARRKAQISLRQSADLAGRKAWAASVRTGQNVHAAQPSDLRAMGMRALSEEPARASLSHGYNPDEPRDGHGRWTAGGAAGSTAHPAASNTRTISYGLLKTPAPSDQELAELRRQQAAQAGVTRKLDIQNSWFAVPALAAPLVVSGLEGAAAVAARTALPALKEAPLDFVERDPYRRVGDNWATRKGRAAHAEFKAKVKSKDGWDPDPPLKRTGQHPLRPDAGTPPRNPEDPDERYYLELKPNTPSGRAAAARAVKRYQGLTKNKVRAVFYDPKKVK